MVPCQSINLEAAQFLLEVFVGGQLEEQDTDAVESLAVALPTCEDGSTGDTPSQTRVEFNYTTKPSPEANLAAAAVVEVSTARSSALLRLR
jgi:hypothetical protein